MADYAYQNVPFYQNLKKENEEIINFRDYPIITRKMLQKRMNLNFAPFYLQKYIRGELKKVSTSGSTGKVLEIFWDNSEYKKSLLSLWILRKKYYNILPNDRYAFFYTTQVFAGVSVSEVNTKNGIGFSKVDLDEDKIIKIYEKLEKFEPVWIIAQPSMMILLITTAKRNGLRPINSIKYIEFTGEHFTETERQMVKDFFKCNVASQYGCYEVNSIAYECPQGNLHLVNSSTYTEVVDDRGNSVVGKEGKIVVTSLHNKVMPFVRYNIGDRGVIHDKKCSCGAKSMVLELMAARDNDMIYTKQENYVHSDVLAHAVDMVNYINQGIIEYKIHQVDVNRFNVVFVLDNQVDREEVEHIFLNSIGKIKENAIFNFEYVEEIYPNSITGKLAWFESDCSNNI